MNLALLDPLADGRWDELVDRASEGALFHRSAWIALLAEHYGYRFGAICVVARGEVVAGLPLASITSRLTGRRLVALPFSDLCPPITRAEAPDGALETLARGVERERTRRAVSLEVRARFDELGSPVPRYHRHVVDLADGLARVEGRYAPMAVRNVKKARRMGVTVERRTDRAALDAFYGLHLVTRRRHGVPTQPRSFIRGLQRLFAEGMGFVALASFEGRPAAAAVCLLSGRTLVYKYGASGDGALHARPNNVVFAEMIRWACEHGCNSVDLGRTDLGQEGLRQFKKAWGANEVLLEYTYRGMEPRESPSRANRALAAVIRRAPPIAGGAVGTALYRHVG